MPCIIYKQTFCLVKKRVFDFQWEVKTDQFGGIGLKTVGTVHSELTTVVHLNTSTSHRVCCDNAIPRNTITSVLDTAGLWTCKSYLNHLQINILVSLSYWENILWPDETKVKLLEHKKFHWRHQNKVFKPNIITKT